MRQIGPALLIITVLVIASASKAATRQDATGSPDALMGQAIHQDEVEGNLEAAIATYRTVVANPGAARPLVASALLRIGLAQERLGQREARAAYERITREFPDQAETAGEARRRLAALSSRDARPDSGMVVRQVWAGDDVDPTGSPSGDGRLFAYVDYSSGDTSNVAVRNLATGETRRLTQSATAADEVAYLAAISPDGRQVAYVTWESNGPSLRVMNADGSNSRVLYQEAGVLPSAIKWSPDGRQLAVVLQDYGGGFLHHIAVVGTAGGDLRRVKSTGPRSPVLGGVSPDGRFLVYSLFPDGGVFATTLDGMVDLTLVQAPSHDTSPLWTPDGRGVVFLSDRSGTQDLWFLRVVDGRAVGEPELLRANVGTINSLGFTRDGTYFYGTADGRTDVYICDLDPATLQVRATSRLSDRFVGANAGPAWSPDGRFVAFMRGKDRRKMSIVVRTLADGSERTLPTTLTDSIMAAWQGIEWTHDSRAVLVPDADYIQQRFRIRRVDVESGAGEIVVEGALGEFWAHTRLSRDGKTLFLTRRGRATTPETGILRLMRRDLETGEETELFRAESSGIGFFALTPSPDGSELAFMVNESKGGRALMSVPVGGGAPRVLYRGTFNRPILSGAAWTSDGRYVLAPSADGQASRLWAFAADGSQPVKLDLMMQGLLNLGLSPDGRRLVFTGAQRKSELWTITNLLPVTSPSRVNR